MIFSASSKTLPLACAASSPVFQSKKGSPPEYSEWRVKSCKKKSPTARLM
jgi:hypothetical protein